MPLCRCVSRNMRARQRNTKEKLKTDKTVLRQYPWVCQHFEEELHCIERFKQRDNVSKLDTEQTPALPSLKRSGQTWIYRRVQYAYRLHEKLKRSHLITTTKKLSNSVLCSQVLNRSPKEPGDSTTQTSICQDRTKGFCIHTGDMSCSESLPHPLCLVPRKGNFTARSFYEFLDNFC